MREFFRYFKFYYRITRGRLLVVLALAFAGTACHGMMCAALYAVLNFTTPLAEMNFLARNIFHALDLAGVADPAWRLATLLILAVIASAVSGIFLLYDEYYVACLRMEIAVRLQAQALHELLDSRYEYILTRNAGHLNNIIVSQIRVAAQSLRFFSTVITHTFLAGLYLAMPFVLDYRVAIGMVLVCLPLFPLIRFINRRIRSLSVAGIKVLGQVNEFMLQTLGNVKYLKATGTHPALIDRFTVANQEYSRLTRNLAVWSSFGAFGLPPFAIAMISLLVFWKIFVGEEQPIEVLLILGILYAAAQKAITIPTSFQKFVGTLGSIVAYEDLARELAEHAEPVPTGVAVAPDFGEELTFDQVSFQYAAGKEPVLRDLALTIPARSCVAFVGGSGAGKSTVVNLITGLLRPASGEMRLGGTAYAKLDLAALRAGIGYVTQEAVVFGDTVRNNLTLWHGGLSDEEVRAAVRQAHAEDFLATMPSGYETILGDHGFTISGGQRQRLAIAREILRRTPILILDEATSALDTATEQLIQESIRSFQGDKTMVIIAHRLSTIRHCDRIYVLEQGRLVENGTYDELYQRGGTFRAMVDRQSLE